ncbi:MAG: O-antigen ligase family protein [Anaerolineae bacterium]|nr:O-antigen ligase family protein [Anaerolineae bacterium]
MAHPSTYDSRIKATVPAQRSKAGVWIAIGLVAHVPLALILQANRPISNIHPLAVTALGLWMLYRRAPLVQFAYLAAYIAGAEVFWRMTRANIFWEYGKYLTVFLLALALRRHQAFKISRLPLIYFLLLIPSAIITLLSATLFAARDALSFNLSGHLALIFCVWFFSRIRFSKVELERLLWFLMVPVVSVATLSFSAVQSVTSWSVNSNNEASGGFSANQVSGILGLGVLAVWILLLYTKPRRIAALAAALLGIWFFAQSLLTLSRGGVLTAVIPGVLITLPVLFMRERRKQMIPLVLGILVFAVILAPALDTITNGTLTARYTETDKRALTGRDNLINAELQVFLDNPLFGVGVGQGGAYRAEIFGEYVATHTEYTRMLAEHGIFGLFAIVLLGVMVLINLKRNWHNPTGRSIVIGVALWALISLTHAAMRTVAPSFIFAIQFAYFEKDAGPQALNWMRRNIYQYRQQFQ